MTPPIARPSARSHYSSLSPASHSSHEHDENINNNYLSLQNNPQWTTTTTTRESAQSPLPIFASGSSGTPLKHFQKAKIPLQSPQGPSISTINNQQHAAAAEAWITKPGSPGLPPRKQQLFLESSSPVATSPSSFQNMMREPLAISNHLSPDHHGTAAVVDNINIRTSPSSQDHPQMMMDAAAPPSCDLDGLVESAMTSHVRRSRNPTEAGVIQDSTQRFPLPQAPPRHDSVKTMDASPSHRIRQPPTPQHPQYNARDNYSVGSGSVPLPAANADWQWGKRSDPDDQEQALFEQRLCEDAYGVAVRKINQNGKSNLRYVKCCVVDMADLEELATASSSKSVSSRVSRGAFSRLRGENREREQQHQQRSSEDPDASSTLLKGKKTKVLTWGKKKDVKLPLERFVCIRKGKTTDRARRNTNPSSRILSLITDDPHHSSLDIEAPTKVDRDKFAKAFAKFLNIPLEGDENGSTSTPQSRGMSYRTAIFSRIQMRDFFSHFHFSIQCLFLQTHERCPLVEITRCEEIGLPHPRKRMLRRSEHLPRLPRTRDLPRHHS